MSHNEADVPCEEELQSKFCMLRNILLRAESDRAQASSSARSQM